MWKWKLFQLAIVCAVVASAIQWQWTPNNYLVGDCAAFAAYAATVFVLQVIALGDRFPELGNAVRHRRSIFFLLIGRGYTDDEFPPTVWSFALYVLLLTAVLFWMPAWAEKSTWIVAPLCYLMFALPIFLVADTWTLLKALYRSRHVGLAGAADGDQPQHQYLRLPRP